MSKNQKIVKVNKLKKIIFKNYFKYKKTIQYI